MRKSCQQHLVSCVYSLRTKNMILKSESEQSAAWGHAVASIADQGLYRLHSTAFMIGVHDQSVNWDGII